MPSQLFISLSVALDEAHQGEVGLAEFTQASEPLLDALVHIDALVLRLVNGLGKHRSLITAALRDRFTFFSNPLV